MMRGLQRHLYLVVGLVFLAGALVVYRLNVHQSIQIQLDGQVYTLATGGTTVAAALRLAGVTLDPADSVRPPLEAAVAAGDTIVVQRAPLAGLWADGDATLVRAGPKPPAELLAAAGLSLGPGDEVWVDGARAADPGAVLPAAPKQLEVRRAVAFALSVDGSPAQTVTTAARTVGGALWELGYQLHAGDEVTPAPDASVSPGLPVALRQARPVLVLADGQSLQTRTTGTTVGDALAQAGVPLVGEDYSQPAEDQPLPEAGLVRVVRVREEVLTEQTLLPFATNYQPLPDVEIDNVYAVQAGLPGVVRKLTRLRYENGVEVSRTEEGEVLVQAPVDQIIGYGTAIVLRTVDTPDGPMEYWRSYTMYATSYAAKFTGRTPGTPSYGRTASGQILTKGLVAIDTSLMPFGTRMYVPGYGLAVAADTGGGVRGRFIDLGFDDFNYESWHQVVTVYFLAPAPPADSIRWIIPSTVP